MNLEKRIFLLESELRDREIEVSLLKETADAISGELDQQKVFQLAVERARNLIMAETVLLPILDVNGTEYTYRAGCGKNADEIVGQSLPLDLGVCGWVWRHKRPWWHGVLAELDEAERNKWEKEAGSIILVPLVGKRNFLGGLAGINKIGGEDFTKRDLDLLSLFANQVSFAIENAALFDQLNKTKEEAEAYQREMQALNTELERRVAQRTSALADAVKELEHLALHDMLTDLPNRSLVEDRLQQSIHIARREKKVLSFLMVDLDRFKEVNDRYGHDAGDGLLKQVAMRLRRVLRQSDTAGRLGGDEFALVLPSTDAAGAAKVAEKLLKVMEPPFKVGDRTLSSACSIGIAVYPEHGVEVAALCKSAEAAACAAKRGKKGYAVYRPEDDKDA
ncbi:MAG: sensor domain-containing diguanylate cyclase [Gammaproteobacteria bacterium]|nr:sensor domain-containing diguanylate cyclase [Gammaproteobacteria bacterium]